jgi:hypothetical protein
VKQRRNIMRSGCSTYGAGYDNSDLSRLAAPTGRDLQRIEKYRRATDLIGRIPA